MQGRSKNHVPSHHATSDYEFSEQETEFLLAIERFKKTTGKQFPTWTDALRVLRSLGWEQKTTAPQAEEKGSADAA